jgi:hypothetical protein
MSTLQGVAVFDINADETDRSTLPARCGRCHTILNMNVVTMQCFFFCIVAGEINIRINLFYIRACISFAVSLGAGRHHQPKPSHNQELDCASWWVTFCASISLKSS